MLAGRAMSSASSRVNGLLPSLLAVLFLCIIPVLSNTYCPPITLGEGSPLYPQRTKGGNVTMYRVFHTDSNPHKVNITWRRQPSSLSSSSGRYRINTTFTKSTARASITVWNLMLRPDIGHYTVTACSNCTCNKTTFVLDIYQCDPSIVPQPMEMYNRTVVREPKGSLYLYLLFHGNTNDFFYVTTWSHDGKDVCDEDSAASDKFSCNRTLYRNCTFAANLYIYHPSHMDSGNYTVQAIGGGLFSRNATIHVDIIDEPGIESCTTGPLKIGHNGHTEFVCHISNYSKYAEVIVVENDRTLFKKSTKDLSFGCLPNVPDSSSATCTVNVSTSLHSGQLHYKLCVGYNSSVPHTTALQCSKDITINITESSDHWNLKMLGLIVGSSLSALLALLLLLLAVRCFRKKSLRTTTTTELGNPSETSPLLGNKPRSRYLEDHSSNQGPVQSLHHKLSPGSSPIQSTTSGESSDGNDVELDFPHKVTAGNRGQDVTVPHRIWKTVRSGPLERSELVHIAKVIHHWSVLARFLGLSKPIIVAIEENHVHDYEEQKIQMLLKWFQQQSTPPTRQSLVRIIEEKMEDPVLAQDITNIVGHE